MDEVDAMTKKLRLVWLALLVSIVLYVTVAEMVKPENVGSVFDSRIVHGALIALAVLLVGVAVVLRQRKVRPFEEEVRSGRVSTEGALSPEQTSQVGRWQGGHLASWIMCEAVALFGFVLRFLGGTRLEAAPFYAVAVLLMVVWMPKKPG